MGLRDISLDVDRLDCSGHVTACGVGTDTPCECVPGTDDVPDSMSVGFYFAASGATILDTSDSD